MRYVQPYGVSDTNASYIDGNPALGIEGSAVPAKALEHTMRELVYLITKAGLTPDEAKLTQVYDAIQALILKAMPKAPEKYDVGQYYWFEDEIVRPSLKPCLGGVIPNISRDYPKMVEYLQSPGGQARCVTQAAWDALHIATWHTNADGTKVGWNGIGGVNKFVLNLAADTLRLPDLAGMMPEMIGCDGLGVGGVHGDAARRTVGSFQAGDASTHVTGPFSWSRNGTATVASGSAPWNVVVFDTYRTGPVGPKNQTRAWGSLACVYLGLPAS